MSVRFLVLSLLTACTDYGFVGKDKDNRPPDDTGEASPLDDPPIDSAEPTDDGSDDGPADDPPDDPPDEPPLDDPPDAPPDAPPDEPPLDDPPDEPPLDDPPDEPDPGDESDPGDSPADDPPPPDSFSGGWYILDEGTAIPTTTNPDRVVSGHGDPDIYWYEPSGVHGLLDSTDPATDFESMRAYVIERVPDPTSPIGMIHYYADSTLDALHEATFTYFLCDFYVETGDDPALYRLDSGSVDDGIQVMVNGAILGTLRLDEGGGSWPLEDHIRVDDRNTLIVILVDDAERNKFVQDMGFYRGDMLMTGGP